MSPMPTFHVTVISRSVQAVNYKHRSGASKLDFAGTDLMPSANGQAKVESKKGYTEIEVEFSNLQKPTTFGNEYLTYILWAISPEGRAINLGEVLVGDNHRSKLDVTTDLQAFASPVTWLCLRMWFAKTPRELRKPSTRSMNCWNGAVIFLPVTSSIQWF
jgi:hypothetical protein